MPKKKTRVTRTRRVPPSRERSAFPILLVLVMGMIVLGMFQYFAVLVAGSVIFVGFFGWLWWTRRAASAAATKTKKAAPRGKRKHRKR
jgi:hypothetical protein